MPVRGERGNDTEYREIMGDVETFYGKYNLNFQDKLVLGPSCGWGGKSLYVSTDLAGEFRRFINVSSL